MEKVISTFTLLFILHLSLKGQSLNYFVITSIGIPSDFSNQMISSRDVPLSTITVNESKYNAKIFASADKSSKLGVSSSSDMSPATNTAGAGAGWEARCKIIGNSKNYLLPLSINFQLDGKMSVSSSPGSICRASGSSSIFDYRIILNYGAGSGYLDIKGSAFLGSTNGYQSLSSVSNDLKSYATNTVTTTVSAEFETSLKELGKIFPEDWKSLFSKWKALSAEERKAKNVDVNYPDSLIQYLTEKTFTVEVANFAVKNLPTSIGNLTALVQNLSPLVPLSIPAGIGKINLSFNNEFNLDFEKSIQINTSNLDIITTYMGVGSKTTGFCQCTSNADFSNSLKLESITLPYNFEHKDVDLNNLHLYVNDTFSIPIVRAAKLFKPFISLDSVRFDAVRISWRDSSYNVSNYEIERSIYQDSLFENVGIVPSRVKSFVNTGLISNRQYFYRIKILGKDKTQLISDVFSVKLKPQTTGNIDLDSSNQLLLFPNPSYDFLFIKYLNLNQENWSLDSYEIFNIEGKKIESGKLSFKNFEARISTSSLPSGMFLLRIYTKKGVVIKSFVKH